jgi:hypothetical protein
MQRSDGTGLYLWKEYLLFNPFKGFRWLTEFDGHWNYVIMTKHKPATSQQHALHLGKNYLLFHKGTAKVTYVLGEFYWRVKVGETVEVEDYIAPPSMLSCEKSIDETVWSVGEYIDHQSVREAFQIQSYFPVPLGVSPNQASHFAPLFTALWPWIQAFIAILIVIQTWTLFFSKPRYIFQENLNYVLNQPDKIKISPTFTIDKRASNLQVTFESPVQNNWLELEASLVNEATGETYDFEQGVEYYSGYDDGNWTEGSQSSETLLPAIPTGPYHINYQVSAPPGIEQVPFSLSIKQNVVTWFNFTVALLLIALYPIWIWWRKESFERARWSTSDYSPYWSENEGIYHLRNDHL